VEYEFEVSREDGLALADAMLAWPDMRKQRAAEYRTMRLFRWAVVLPFALALFLLWVTGNDEAALGLWLSLIWLAVLEIQLHIKAREGFREEVTARLLRNPHISVRLDSHGYALQSDLRECRMSWAAASEPIGTESAIYIRSDEGFVFLPWRVMAEEKAAVEAQVRAWWEAGATARIGTVP
jgi:hypothetical protein